MLSKMNTKFTEIVPCNRGSRTFMVDAMHASEV